MAAYLLGMGPMPSPQLQDVAVAMANHLLDNPNAAVPAIADENIDPRLHAAHLENPVWLIFANLRE